MLNIVMFPTRRKAARRKESLTDYELKRETIPYKCSRVIEALLTSRYSINWTLIESVNKLHGFSWTFSSIGRSKKVANEFYFSQLH